MSKTKNPLASWTLDRIYNALTGAETVRDALIIKRQAGDTFEQKELTEITLEIGLYCSELRSRGEEV